MRLTTTFFIYIILLCIIAYGVVTPEICLGADHCHPQIEWAGNCHEQQGSPHDAHESALGHQEKGCIDILIPHAAGANFNVLSDTPLSIKKPIIIKSAETDHPFFAFDISKLRRSLQPVFTDIIPLSITATVLIV